MKITTLNIYNYKNLTIELQNNSSIIALIGNNGSGKSNILEAISSIFYHLYNKKEKDIPFNFKLGYNIGGTQNVIVEKKNSSIRFTVNDKTYVDIQSFLPKQIVALYSGEENRLWSKFYQPLYLTFISGINKSETSGLGEYTLMPKMLYINKFYWHITLLCLLLSDATDTKTFCQQTLGLTKVNSIKFDFNKANYSNYSDSSVKAFFSLIDKKDEYSLSELKEVITDASHSLDLVYKYLYIAFTPDRKKMLDNITIKYNDENLDIEDFSEGEKKMLLIKGALEFAGMEDSLFLLDEPDAHIHLSNKVQIKNVFNEYLATRQVILTTHSPTLTDILDDDSLFMLTTGKLVPNKKQEILESVSGDFWNKFQQNSFIASKKPIILLLEGRHDKEHILNAFETLKDEHEDIDFQCFVLNGEAKIQPFLSGLYESDFHTDKLYIGVYDNDDAGEKSFKAFDKVNDRFNKLKENNGKINNSYYAIKLPKPDGITCQCTIETMYEASKFEEALRLASQNAWGHLQNKSIDEIAKGIKEQAKNILSDNSKSFIKEDFKSFKPLFNLISEIQKHRDGILNTSADVSKPDVSKPEVVKESMSEVKEDIVEIFTNRRGTAIVAHFYPDTEKVIILPNSIISTDVVASYTPNEKKDRIRTRKAFCDFVENRWKVIKPISFKSPSGAIKWGIGSNLNGWENWIIKDSNEPLSSIREYRSQATQTPLEVIV